MAAPSEKQSKEMSSMQREKYAKKQKHKRKFDAGNVAASGENNKSSNKRFKTSGKKTEKPFAKYHVKEKMKARTNFTNSKHLTKECRVPMMYKQAARILQEVDEKKGSVKNLVFSLRRDIKKVYALVLQSLKYKNIILRLAYKSRLLRKEKQLNPYLARVLIYDMVFGRKSLVGESKPIQTILKHRGDIWKALKRIMEEASVKSAEELLDKERIAVPTIPHYARVNTILTTTADVIKALQDKNYLQQNYDKGTTLNEFYDLIKNLEQGHFAQDFHFPDLLVFSNGENLSQTELYSNGHIILEDKTSYLAAKALSPPEGSTVLDGCAAPGIKTTHLAALMNNKGKIFACDVNEKRMEMLKDMIKFTGVNCSSTIFDDFTCINPKDEQYSSVEYILLDPTCSGSGMVSRLDSLTDDEKSKCPERIKKLSAFQTILLKHALSFENVKRIVYSTCSVNVEEDEEVVKEALVGWEETYKVVNAFPDWPTRGKEEYEFGPLCLRAYPNVNYSNGFFIAVIEKIEGSTGTKKKKKNKKNTVSINNEGKTHICENTAVTTELNRETVHQEKCSDCNKESKEEGLETNTTVKESVALDLKHCKEKKSRRERKMTENNARKDIALPKQISVSGKSDICDTVHTTEERKISETEQGDFCEVTRKHFSKKQKKNRKHTEDK